MFYIGARGGGGKRVLFLLGPYEDHKGTELSSLLKGTVGFGQSSPGRNC